MCNDTTFSEALRDEIHLDLDELARRGAQRMLAAALQAEVDEYIHRHSNERDEYKAWRKRSLADKNYVYLWADGVHFNVRLEEDRLACLTLVGVLPDGSKDSPQSRPVREQPKAPDRALPAWLWLSSCLLRPKGAGAESIHPTWSHSLRLVLSSRMVRRAFCQTCHLILLLTYKWMSPLNRRSAIFDNISSFL